MKDIGLELFIAATGLLLLGIMATQTPEEKDIEDLDASDIGAKVNLEGNITDMQRTENAIFMELEGETGDIPLVYFEEGDVGEGPSTVSGRVDLYQGNLQIIVEQASLNLES